MFQTAIEYDSPIFVGSGLPKFAAPLEGGSGICVDMRPGVSGEELQAVRHALLNFQRRHSVIAATEGGRFGQAVAG